MTIPRRVYANVMGLSCDDDRGIDSGNLKSVCNFASMLTAVA